MFYNLVIFYLLLIVAVLLVALEYMYFMLDWMVIG